MDCLKCFGKLIPESMHHLICIESDQYLPPIKCRLLSVLPQVAVPQPSEKVFRIDFMDDTNVVHIKWLGTCPNKCMLIRSHLDLFTVILFLTIRYLFVLHYIVPSLLTKILKAVDENLLTDLVLLKQIRALVEEWKKYVLENESLQSKHLLFDSFCLPVQMLVIVK